MKQKASFIRGLAIAVPLLVLIIGLIAASKTESFGQFLVYAIGAVLYYILTSSYADLLDATADTKEMVQKLLEGCSPDSKGSAPVKPAIPVASVKPITPVASTNTATIKTADKDPAPIPCEDPNYIECGKCGKRQKSNREVCFNCGASLVSKLDT